MKEDAGEPASSLMGEVLYGIDFKAKKRISDLREFDARNYLDSPEVIAAYRDEAVMDGLIYESTLGFVTLPYQAPEKDPA